MDAAVRALSCCCIVNDQTDANQITYPVSNLGFDEGHLAKPLHLPPSGVGQFGRPGRGQSLEPESELLSSRSSAAAPPTARSLLPEEREKEKERLQDMVKEFAKAVVQGQPCQYLPGVARAAQLATYSFDKSLRVFTLLPDDSPQVVFEMGKISDVTKDVRGTPFEELARLQPPHSLAGEELEKRFACVQFVGGSGLEHLGLMLPNALERERFYTCMKILRWAIESRRSRG